ncbi:asparaginase [Methylosoma difficile]
MTNILLVFTGGTIGSVANEGTISPSETAKYQLLERFKQKYPNNDRVNFQTIQPLQILSENLAPAAWDILVAAIQNANPELFDGVIVTHGTDTLAYSAAALSFCFRDCPVPILLVSSDFPLHDPRANGVDNFICAVEYILQKGRGGVFVPYRNPGQVCQLHHGSRLTSSLQLGGEFYSVQNNSYCQFSDGQFLPDGVIGEKASGFSNAPIALPKPEAINMALCQTLLMVRPYPGLDYGHFNLENVTVVLHDLYHSGTACVSEQWGETHSLVAFLRRCKVLNIKVYLAPSLYSDALYQTAKALMAEGAEMIWNMSIEAAYAKLLLAYSNFGTDADISNFLHSDYAGERV